MAEFKISTKDGQEFTITANDEAQAIDAFKRFQNTNYTGPEDANGVPEGMVLDPNTGAMVDAKALSEMKLKDAEATNLGMQPAKGLPFVGSWVDEAMGWLGSSDKPYDSAEVNTEMYRQLDKRTAEKYPKSTTALQVAGSLSAVPAAIASAPAIPGAAAATQFAGRFGMLGKTAAAAAAAAPAAYTEGYVSGYGNQQQGKDRSETASQQAKFSGTLGTILGGAAPGVSALVGSMIKRGLDSATISKQLAKLGIDPSTAEQLKRSLNADDAISGKGAQRITDAGPDAMLADAGPTTRDLLDSAVRFSDKGGREALDAVTDRANKQKSALDLTLDSIMGKVKGVRQATKEIGKNSAAERGAAYDALNQPIDYASDAGREIERVFSTTPRGIKSKAIELANMLIERGGGKKQIMADIAEDGTIKFREMPNAYQADQLKRALQAIERDGTDSFGKKSTEADIAGEVARELRDAMVKALPGYDKALKAGQDRILSDEGLRLGTKLLSDKVSREDVEAFVKRAPDEARVQIMVGLRRQLDEIQAKVKNIPSDADAMEARQVIDAWKSLSSDANRAKVAMVIGEKDAATLFKYLDQTTKALELRAGVARNSATAMRTRNERNVAESVKAGPIAAVRRGEIMNAPKQAWQKLSGGTPEAEQARIEEVWGQIAQILTGPRGQKAQDVLQGLLYAYRTGAANQEASRLAGKGLTGAVALPVYQQTQQPSR